MSKRFALVYASFFMFSQPAGAVPHIRPESYPNVTPCNTRTFTSRDMRRHGSIRSAIISTATGTKTIAVVIVQFPSAGGSTSGSGSIQNLGNFDSYFNAMDAFYTENSFGKLDLTFRFFGAGTVSLNGEGTAAAIGSAYTMPQPMEYYGCGDVDTGCSGVPSAPAGYGGAYLIRDAITAARVGRPGFISTVYDAVLVMHAGVGNETTTSNGDIWSAFYQDEPGFPVITNAGGGFEDGAVFPELESSGISSPLGVMCHEFGHVLTLPDLYNTAVFGGASVVGKWDLMDAGPYLGSGANPSHLGAWCKAYLSWAEPQTTTGRGVFTLNTVSAGGLGNANQVLKLPIQNSSATEYFLVEYRSNTAAGAVFDKQIPGTGLLIWHIDDAINNARGFSATDSSLQNKINTGSPHYGVSIVTADGLPAAPGLEGNAFRNDQVFTSPKSDNFNRDPSGVNVLNISGVGGAAATFNVTNLAVSANQAIRKAVNFPNPSGKGYSHPQGEGHTTLQIHLTRPTNDRQINIYTLSGDLVRKIGMGDLSYNDERSADEKWVYEYVWDLTNGDGRHVAPGVYLYLIRADGESKSGKAVVIR